MDELSIIPMNKWFESNRTIVLWSKMLLLFFTKMRRD